MQFLVQIQPFRLLIFLSLSSYSLSLSSLCVLYSALAESDLEEMALHETEDYKVFQRFKKKIAPEPHQVGKKQNKRKLMWKKHLNGLNARCVPVSPCFVLLCSGGALQSRRVSPVGLFPARPFRSGYPTMHLWRQEDFWVSGSRCFLSDL